ncbi:MAG TPA: YigZ family protein [Chitinophagaceae bacterium]|nr:YigZ family protein [Chitinophagaceae bacterium]
METSCTAEFKDRGSKFLAFAYPISSMDDVKKYLHNLKDLHPKAVHFCYAFRLGTDGNLFRAADDGEPSGSAGKPILGQIDSLGITNILVIIVRYFGGTLLGVPGLIHAYKTSTQLALQSANIIEKKIEKIFLLEFTYDLMNEVMRILKQYHVNIIKNDMKLFCEFEIGISLDDVEGSIEKLNKLRGVTVKVK